MKPETINLIRRVVFALGGLLLVYILLVQVALWLPELFR